ncbi:MAG: four-carbon acid sugar kinase family protein [Ilumatobacteraceae bacterium]
MNADRTSLIVTADDSTGATEAAAACADAGLAVDVVPFGVSSAAAACVVIDLRSRHIAPAEARRRITAVTTDEHRVHKIDSTLRGNWSVELAALADAGRRVVLIPSHPLAGRVCVGGVVFVNGVPVADSELGNDIRLPVRSSRPSDSLPGAELAGPQPLAQWLSQRESSIAIVDATSLAEINELVHIALDADDVVVSGPASVAGAVAGLWSPGGQASLPHPLLPEPIVVVCASLHPVSRAQIDKVGAAGIAVVTSSQVRHADPELVAAEVARRAHRLVGASGARSVVLIGGDTAEAFIGDNVVSVFGSIDVGVSLGDVEIRGMRLRIASKPGGFGTPNTLVDLVTR